MQFDQVEIVGFEEITEGADAEGVVALIANGRRVSVMLRWKPKNAQPKHDWVSGLLTEAMRQVKRMPEFRRGPEPVLLSDALIA